MSLKFIIGGAGTGKSYTAYENVIREAESRPDVLYYIIVPEQFTMQTQKNVVSMSSRGGILNIDVLSFQRLAYRVFEETGGDTLALLDDIGKSMILRKLTEERESDYPYLGNQIRKPGCLDEVKSLISEFMQYDISPEEVAEMAESAGERTLMNLKLSDVSRLYGAFRDYLENRYMTSEGVMEELTKMIPLSERLKGSVIVFDGFTGFTPVQLNAVRELLAVCRDMTVTVTLDARENPYKGKNAWQLFSMSKKMIRSLSGLTKDIDDPILLYHSDGTRFSHADSLAFLEQNIFRYKKGKYEGRPQNIKIVTAGSPRREMEDIASSICRMVREKGVKYGEIAVITGNLEEYGPAAAQVFEKSDIPYFLDETHSIMQNPFIEYVRASLELIDRDFSSESVMRYLRTGLSDISAEEADRLENYVKALGIRGFGRWNDKWVRVYRGMDPAEIAQINDIRERFVQEIAEFKENNKGNRTVREHCTQLYLFFRKNRIQEKLKEQQLAFGEAGERRLEKEYAQIYSIVLDLLDRMTEILGDEKMNRREFTRIFETGLSKAKVALIPPGQDCVMIGDMERTRLKDVKALFFAGVNEGSIPKAASGGGILSEADRDFLAGQGIELAPDPKEQMNVQRFYLYLNLTKPSEFLQLSFSRTNQKGESQSPAYLIGTLTTLFPGLTVTEAEEEQENEIPENTTSGFEALIRELPSAENFRETPLFAELFRRYLRDEKTRAETMRIVEAAFMRAPEGKIGSTVAKALYGDVPENGATRLERFAACACAHFLRYGLRLSERQEYEFKDADLGNLVHEVLEYFEKALREEGLTLRTVDEEKKEELLNRCLDTLAADYGNTILKSSARNRWMIERARAILRRTIDALQQQVKAGKFDPEGVEIAFAGGRIDRVDVMQEDNRVYVKVIDYKTGNTTFELLKLYHGLQVQLVLYLDAALTIEQKKHPESEVIPAGIFYYNVKDPIAEGSPDDIPEDIEKEILKTLKMNGIATKDTHILEAMDSTFVSLPVTMKKGNELGARSSVADEKQFDVLLGYVKTMTGKNRDRILDGETAAEPYRMGTTMPCDYCAYRTVCGFDRNIPGYSYREIRKMDDQELWKRMEEVQDGSAVD